VWGEVKGSGKEAKGYGLSKIIEKHGEDFKEFGEGLEGVSKGLDEIITKGEIHTQEYGRKTIIYHKNGDVYKVGLKQNKKGEPTKNSWVITSYKEDREADKFIHSSDFTKGETLPLNSNESIAQKHKDNKIINTLKDMQDKDINVELDHKELLELYEKSSREAYDFLAKKLYLDSVKQYRSDGYALFENSSLGANAKGSFEAILRKNIRQRQLENFQKPQNVKYEIQTEQGFKYYLDENNEVVINHKNELVDFKGGVVRTKPDKDGDILELNGILKLISPRNADNMYLAKRDLTNNEFYDFHANLRLANYYQNGLFVSDEKLYEVFKNMPRNADKQGLDDVMGILRALTKSKNVNMAYAQEFIDKHYGLEADYRTLARDIFKRVDKEYKKNGNPFGILFNDQKAIKDLRDMYGDEMARDFFKGENAVDFLLYTQAGHIEKAFYKEGLGDIDLVWGDENFGLRHILEQRAKQWGEEKALKFISHLSENIEKGQIVELEKGRVGIKTDLTTIILDKKENNNFVLTAFRDRNNKKELESLNLSQSKTFTSENAETNAKESPVTPLNQESIIAQNSEKLPFEMQVFAEDKLSGDEVRHLANKIGEKSTISYFKDYLLKMDRDFHARAKDIIREYYKIEPFRKELENQWENVKEAYKNGEMSLKEFKFLSKYKDEKSFLNQVAGVLWHHNNELVKNRGYTINKYGGVEQGKGDNYYQNLALEYDGALKNLKKWFYYIQKANKQAQRFFNKNEPQDLKAKESARGENENEKAEKEELTNELLEEAKEQNAKIWVGNLESENLADELGLNFQKGVKITMNGNALDPNGLNESIAQKPQAIKPLRKKDWTEFEKHREYIEENYGDIFLQASGEYHQKKRELDIKKLESDIRAYERKLKWALDDDSMKELERQIEESKKQNRLNMYALRQQEEALAYKKELPQKIKELNERLSYLQSKEGLEDAKKADKNAKLKAKEAKEEIEEFIKDRPHYEFDDENIMLALKPEKLSEMDVLRAAFFQIIKFNPQKIVKIIKGWGKAKIKAINEKSSYFDRLHKRVFELMENREDLYTFFKKYPNEITSQKQKQDFFKELENVLYKKEKEPYDREKELKKVIRQIYFKDIDRTNEFIVGKTQNLSEKAFLKTQDEEYIKNLKKWSEGAKYTLAEDGLPYVDKRGFYYNDKELLNSDKKEKYETALKQHKNFPEFINDLMWSKGYKYDGTLREYFLKHRKSLLNEGSFKLNEANVFSSNPLLGAGLVGGTLNGVEQDEEGNLSFDPVKFVAGFLGGSLGSKAVSMGFRHLEKNPALKEKIINELADTLEKGFEKAREKYPLLSMLEPRYIIQNERGRKIQAKVMLKELEKEQKGLFNVAYNGKNASLIKQDLQSVESAIAFMQGTRYKGAKHERIKHLTDPSKEGYVTDLEFVNLGKSIREFLKNYEPFIDTNGARLYEWENKDKVRFRVVINDVADMDSNPTTATEEIITFYSDRNLKEKMKFKNPVLKDTIAQASMQGEALSKELEKSFLDESGRVDYKSLMQNAEKLPKELSLRGFKQMIFNNDKTKQLNAENALIKTPVGEVKVNVLRAFNHYFKQAPQGNKKENRQALNATFMLTLLEPKFVTRDEAGTLYYYKPFISKDKQYHITSIAVKKNGNLDYATSYNATENRLRQMIKYSELVYMEEGLS
ncbi:DUF3519 domain-containing protein, partial [Campylobacter vulpis]|uniref:putative barnase/colicin E5 family endoribonuclease n=1 Tax=Campylobacter vulpis TaxID=1655500 RepID=UPI001BD0C379